MNKGMSVPYKIHAKSQRKEDSLRHAFVSSSIEKACYYIYVD